MSGWIKFEKDLADDPRVKRMSRDLRNAEVTHGRFVSEKHAPPPREYIAKILGGLAQLWFYADKHIRNDNTIPLGIDDINEIVGIEGFAQIIPEHWLHVLDAETVELPDFLEHNGPEAKKAALNARRQEWHRERVTLDDGDDKRSSNSLALLKELPDKTRLDKTREEGAAVSRGTSPRASRSVATRLPEDFKLTPERSAYAEQQRVDPQRTFENFRDYWTAASGAKARKCDWDATWRMWCRREQSAPTTNGGGNRFQQQAPNHGAAWAEAKARAKAIGFRDPLPAETPSSYMTDIKRAETTPTAVPIAERRGLSGIKRVTA